MKTRLEPPKLLSYFLAFLLITFSPVFAQERANEKDFCLTERLLQQSIENDPELIKKLDQQDQDINSFGKNILPSPIYKGGGHLNKSGGSTNFVIPVVVYVVHQNGIENITDVQVISQINKLNTEFDGHGVQFCLATKEGATPLPGSASNPGIVHVNSSLTNHLTSNEAGLKALSPLPSDRYMKIWVVKSINSGSGILGYARFPGTVAPALEGIVMRYDAFGDVATCGCTNLLPSNNQGKVLAHEVGHYLNLYHTFHNGCSGMNASTCDLEGDRVCDTPPVASNNFGCPAPGSVNSCIETPDFPDLLDNHMDYTNDNCRTSFTTGQETRMISAINLYRTTLVSSANLLYTDVQCTGGLIAAFSVSNYSPCSGEVVNFAATTISGATYTWDFGDGSPTITGNPVSHTYVTGGTNYNVILTVDDGSNSVSETQEIYVSDCSPISSSNGNWYFYERAGLDFSSGAPVADDAAWVNNTITNVGSGSIGEACADQSDASGNLLFYTDAIHVWDENHALINSGNDLFGNVSTARGTMIIQNPGNTNEYYVFTSSTTGPPSPSNNKGFRYSKVQVSGTAASMTTSINIPILSPAGYDTGDNGAILTGEGITAVASCDGYWIICNGRKSGTRYLVVYELTASGIAYHSEYNTISNGYYSIIEASPNGEKLARSTFAATNGSYLYDFDKSSGTVTSETQLNSYFTYGVSFSPNSELLYISRTGGGLYQYDVTDATPATPEILVASASLRGLEAGPDNKIYGAVAFSTKLAVINQPNVLSTVGTPNACVFNISGPGLNTVASGVAISARWGLPNMIDATTTSVYSNTFTCSPFGGCFIYNFLSDVCTSSYSWNFGDPASGGSNTSTLQDPSHTFSGPGTYTVTLNAGGTIITKTITVGLNVNVNGPTTVCLQNGGLHNYSASGAPLGVIYNWSVTGGTISGLNGLDNVDINWASLPGTLTLTVSEPMTGCVATIVTTVTENCDTILPCDECKSLIPKMQIDKKGDCTFSFQGGNNGIVCPSQQYVWTVYDNSSNLIATIPGQNVSYTFPTSGSYVVCLTIFVEDAGGNIRCKREICNQVEADCGTPCDDCKSLIPIIKVDTQDSCTFSFEGLNDGVVCPSQQYVWNIYDNTSTLIATISGQNISYTFPSSGVYKVCLTIFVEDANGNIKCKRELCIEVEAYCGTPCDDCKSLIPVIKIDTQDQCTFTFEGGNDGVVCPSQQYVWNIFDNTSTLIATISGQNINYTFPSSGSYKVCLTIFVEDANGNIKCKRELCIEVEADCGTPCDDCKSLIPVIKIDTQDDCTFTFEGTNDGVVCPSQEYVWNIYDNTSTLIATISGQNVSYTFPSSGSYKVCLTIFVEDGNGNIKCKKELCIEVEADCGVPCDDCKSLIPAIKIDTQDNCTFTFKGANDGVVCPSQQYVWNIFDNTSTLIATISGQNVSYTFPSSGSYKVCLTIFVEDVNGNIKCKKELCVEVEADCGSPCDDCKSLIPVIKIDTQDDCTFSFEGLNDGVVCPSQQYVWTIFDNSSTLIATISGQNISYTFPSSGVYKVCLTIFVEDVNGNLKCKKQSCIEIEADCGAPCDDCKSLIPAIKIDTQDQCTFTFEGTNDGVPCPSQQYVWNIYDNTSTLISIVSGQNISYTFPSSGSYRVCLTIFVEDANGNTKCKKELCVEVEADCGAPCDDCKSLIPAIKIDTQDQCTFTFEGVNDGVACPSQQYVWNIYDNSSTLIATISGQNINYTFPSSGVYKVCLTIFVEDANGNTKCKKQLCIEVEADCKKKAGALKAWPNPSNGAYFLNVNINDFNQDEISVYNVMGRLVPFTVGAKGDLSFIELKSKEKGIYLLRLQKDGEIMQIKIVKN